MGLYRCCWQILATKFVGDFSYNFVFGIDATKSEWNFYRLFGFLDQEFQRLMRKRRKWYFWSNFGRSKKFHQNVKMISSQIHETANSSSWFFRFRSNLSWISILDLSPYWSRCYLNPTKTPVTWLKLHDSDWWGSKNMLRKNIQSSCIRSRYFWEIEQYTMWFCNACQESTTLLFYHNTFCNTTWSTVIIQPIRVYWPGLAGWYASSERPWIDFNCFPSMTQ